MVSFITSFLPSGDDAELDRSSLIAVDAGHYTSFLYGYISLVHAMLAKFQGRRDPGSLTGVMILCFMLSCVFHSPPKTFAVY